MGNKFVTIIIPVYKDWARLSLCLTALTNQSYPKELCEILLVNNSPEDDIPKEYFIPQNCSVIKESKPGSYAARNAALKLARGEIIGFTDSDCIPDENWIKNAVDYFDNNNLCSRIAGNVSIFFKNLKPTKAELYDKFYAFNQFRNVSILGTSVTANLFSYKYVFDKIGLFDDSLMSGGDFRWGIHAHKAGYNIHYVKSVIVNHPARYSVDELIKKERRIGGQVVCLKKDGNTMTNLYNHSKALYQFLKDLLPNFAELKYINHNGKSLNTSNKIYLLFLRHYLLSIRAYEKFMVQMGRKAKRV
ncbi:MAG: glycosyltransferase family A protein [Ginsengibacter sp.]